MAGWTAGPAMAMLDLNQNGWSDVWEAKYFPQGEAEVDFDPEADPDGDGWTNREEEVAGTNPFLSQGETGWVRTALKYEPAIFGNDPGGGGEVTVVRPPRWELSWNTLGGKSYVVESSTTLEPGSWVEVTEVHLAVGGPQKEILVSTLPDGGEPPALFWRVRVRDADQDQDGLSDAEEWALGTVLVSRDSDQDGVEDGDELKLYGTDPLKADTDGDGVADGDEIAQGKSGTDPLSFPPHWVYVSRELWYDFNDYTSPAGDPLPYGWIQMKWGHLYYWEEEEWIAEKVNWSELSDRLSARLPFPALPEAGVARSDAMAGETQWSQVAHVMPDPPCEHAYLEHRRYWLVTDGTQTEPVTRKFLRLNRRKLDEEPTEWNPEWVTATVEVGQTVSPAVDLLTSFGGTSQGTQVQSETVEVNLLPMGATVDVNRDGLIQYETDETTPEKPYAFWTNADRDEGNTVDQDDWEEDDLEVVVPDSNDGLITCRRDLEDFSRIWVDGRGLDRVLEGEGSSLQLKVTLLSDHPEVSLRLFAAVEEDGGNRYLFDEACGWNQIQADHGFELLRVRCGEEGIVPERGWREALGKKCLPFLYEGIEEGKAELVFEWWKDGQKVLSYPPIFLELYPVESFYDTWSVGASDAPGVQFDIWPAAEATKLYTEGDHPSRSGEEKDYVLFVHGWNMALWDKRAYAATMFKRLWHLGYRGRFGAFEWPTFHGFPDLSPEELHTGHFDGSEERAWNSAAPLRALVGSLQQEFRDEQGRSLVRLYAHSMGNVVASEALRQMNGGAEVHTYISAQAALSSHVWDPSTPVMTFVKDTPDVYGYYWLPTANSQPHLWRDEGTPSYMTAASMPSATRFINHYNPEDWALGGLKWQLNQKMKPNVYHYYSAPGNPGGSVFEDDHAFWTSKGDLLGRATHVYSFPDERFYIFSYMAESHAFATGSMGDTGGVFQVNESLDVGSGPGFDFGDRHKGHSAQFRSTPQARHFYWVRTLEDMGIQVDLRR